MKKDLLSSLLLVGFAVGLMSLLVMCFHVHAGHVVYHPLEQEATMEIEEDEHGLYVIRISKDGTPVFTNSAIRLSHLQNAERRARDWYTLYVADTKE